MENQTKQDSEIGFHLLTPDGPFPNNPGLPLLIMCGAIPDNSGGSAEHVKELFQKNGWENSWAGGIYDYHHFHSNSHEALGVVKGEATVQFGGTDGIVEKIKKGDVIMIPAGVAHKCVHASDDFEVVGAYPDGQDFDLIRAEEGEERRDVAQNVNNVPLPNTDPLYGAEGPLFDFWQVDPQYKETLS